MSCEYLSFSSFQTYPMNSGEAAAGSSLKLVQIYFDTDTFDDIERDKKIKYEAQLSLIGGTMGLLTGFSIISGIEIVLFVFRWIIWAGIRFLKFSSRERQSDNLKN